MHAGVLWQTVGDEDAYAVAFHGFDGRAGRAAVVAPAACARARRKLVFDFLCDQMELLHAADHAMRQSPAVGRTYGCERAVHVRVACVALWCLRDRGGCGAACSGICIAWGRVRHHHAIGHHMPALLTGTCAQSKHGQ